MLGDAVATMLYLNVVLRNHYLVLTLWLAVHCKRMTKPPEHAAIFIVKVAEIGCASMMADGVSARVADLYAKVLAEPDSCDLVAELASALADSGTRRRLTGGSADIASTGGPSSLSTLLCPLYLVNMGLTVPKIGVAGRPAGGIDVLGTVPGYRTQLSLVDFDNALRKVGYVHVVADDTWTPADVALFRLRQQRGTQANPSLAAASLLAKKLAAGVQIAGLDARVARHGNFGTNIAEARRSADVYCGAALKLGLRPVVFLTDGQVPCQPFVGRGEALTAIAMVASGKSEDDWLNGHAGMCLDMAQIVKSVVPPTSGRTQAPLAGEGIAYILDAHLGSQGSSIAELNARVSAIADQDRQLICATDGGFVHYNLPEIRDMILDVRTAASPGRGQYIGRGEYTDTTGVRLLCPPARKVRRGEPVVELRGPIKAATAAEFRMFTITESAGGPPNVIQEVVAP